MSWVPPELVPLTVALSTAAAYGLLFTAAYFGCRWDYSQKIRVDWSSRIVSNTQCIVSGYSAFHILVLDEQGARAMWDTELATFGRSESRELCMLLFVGYLIYDLCLVLHNYSTFPDPSLMLHHVLILLAYSAGLASGWATFYLGGLLVNELSTPFINRRYTLKHQGLEESTAYLVNGMLLVVTFFVFRMVVCTAVVVHIGAAWKQLGWAKGMLWVLPASHLCALAMLSCAAIGHLVINALWFRRIVAAALRHAHKGEELKKQS